MKLFITNRQEWEEQLKTSEIPTSQMHKDLFNQLRLDVSVKYSIPLTLITSYDDEGFCLFDFQAKKDDIYYYTFNGTAK